MTVTVRDEIELNNLKYKIKGGVTGAFLDPFPEQFTLGDADYANRRDLSSWIMQDLTGGIGVEEMDEKADWNKCWWTDCIIKFRNHILPPRLATEITLPADSDDAATFANLDMELNSDWTNGAQSGDQKHGGAKSWLVTAAGGGNAYQDASNWSDDWRGKVVAIGGWVYDAAIGGSQIGIDDKVGGTISWSSPGTSTIAWEYRIVVHKFAADATRFRIYLESGGGSQFFYDDLAVLHPITGTTVKFANFNSEQYLAEGKVLYKLNAGRTAYDPVGAFPATITAIIPSLNSRLYIYLGDSDEYYYMTTAGVFTESDSANAYWGFQHDAKLFKVNTSGTVEYSTDPDGAAPTWTTAGAITDIAAQIEGFVVYRDAAGAYVPYAATHSILKAYDSATPQWIDTEATLANHPIGGKGHAYWNGMLYLSHGLGVKEYNVNTGKFPDIGLTERDGLPVEYNGEIVKLYAGGEDGVFAAIDASVTSGNSKSGLYLYDGYGWQCWWVDTTNNGAMHDIIVSSASSGYAVYWDVGGKIYYIDIPRGIENPDKIFQSYATSGIFISPWFDAGNPVAAKLAKVLEDYAKGITTTETVALKYRLDHINTDLDTGWTTLDTLNTAGETGHNEELFGSGAGISFKAIQFRLDFVTPGATAKPDIQSLVLYHKKRTGSEKLRVWHVTVICDNYALTTAKQKVANLKAAVISTVDVVFSYHPNDASDESYYVTVNCPKFSEQTGREYEANYELTLLQS